jgi:hypothetical protein
MTSFRPLLYFWCAIAAIAMLGAMMLQVLGPPGPAAPPAPPLVASHLQHYDTPNAAPPPPIVSILKADPSLLEPSAEAPSRLLPKIDENGRTPAQAYAAKFDPAERHPHIALVIDGIGLDRALSAQVLHDLPRMVDIAFSAYAVPEVTASLMQLARAQGRECLVSIPMEPSGFPVVEEGDKMLLTGGIPEQNRLNLEWALSGVQGCVGATAASDGMAGERFAESRQAFGNVLAELDQRGLIYLDPRPGARHPTMPWRAMPCRGWSMWWWTGPPRRTSRQVPRRSTRIWPAWSASRRSMAAPLGLPARRARSCSSGSRSGATP